MCAPTSQASPSRMSAYERARLARPSRRDLTSVPVSTSPASTSSSRWYSCRTRRLSAISFSPLAFAIRRKSMEGLTAARAGTLGRRDHLQETAADQEERRQAENGGDGD